MNKKEYTTKIASIMKGRKTLPITEYLYLSKNQITATNLQEWAIFECEHDLHDTLVEYKEFQTLVKLWKEFSIEKINGNVYAVNGTSSKRINALPANGNFPEPPERTEGQALAQKHIDSYNECLSFVSKDSTRFFLQGVFIGEHIVSTDGKRMHVAPGIPQNEGIIQASKLLNKFTCVDACINENGLFADSSDFHVIIRKVDFQFPNYKRLLPEYNNNFHKFMITPDIQTAIKEAGAFLQAENKERDDIILDTNLVGYLPIKTPYTTENLLYKKDVALDIPFAMAFNFTYILDYLALYPNTIATVTDDNHVMVLQNNDTIHLIMPMKKDVLYNGIH